MTRKQLESYRVNKRLVERNKSKLEDEKCRDIPSVSGKVKGSSHDFPYIEQRFTVKMNDPTEADKSRKRIEKLEQEIEKEEREIEEVERFIAGIEDAREMEVMQLYYTEGNRRMSQREIANAVGYTQGRVSQIIGKYAKD